MTLKKAIQRGLLGAPLGIFLSYTITILISAVSGNSGQYNPVVPQLAEAMNTEIAAVILQYVLSALLGFAFAMGSTVFEIEEWSITKQTVVHFLIFTISMFPIAYYCYWMEHTVWGILSYITIFVVFYAIVWAIQIYFWKKRITKINDGLKNR